MMRLEICPECRRQMTLKKVSGGRMDGKRIRRRTYWCPTCETIRSFEQEGNLYRIHIEFKQAGTGEPAQTRSTK